VGKSFLLRKVVDRLDDYRWRGFLSEAVTNGTIRTGWRLQGLNGEGGVLAHTGIDSSYRMGKYGVDMDLFSRIARAELVHDATVDLFAIDEIGILSSWDPEVETLIEETLSSAVPAVAIVRDKGEGFTARVRVRNDVEIREVTLENRDELVDEVVKWIRSR